MRRIIFLAIFFSFVFLFAGCTMPWEKKEPSLLERFPPTPPEQVQTHAEEKVLGNKLNWTNFFIRCDENRTRIVRLRTNVSLCDYQIINKSNETEIINISKRCSDENRTLYDLLWVKSDDLNATNNDSLANKSKDKIYSFTDYDDKFLINSEKLSICNLCDINLNENLSVELNQTNSTNDSICDIINSNESTLEYRGEKFLRENESDVEIWDYYANGTQVQECEANNSNKSLPENFFSNDTNFIFYCNKSKVNESEGNESNVSLLPHKGLEIFFFDVGFGDATLIRTKDYTMLIDTGREGAKSRYENITLIDTLKRLKVGLIDTFVVSSWDPEKISGVGDMLDEFNINEIWDDGQRPTYGEQKKAYDIIERFNFFEVIPYAGMTLKRGDLEFRFYNPQKDERFNEKYADSIVMSIKYKNFCTFFPGEVEPDAEVLVIDRNKDIQRCPVYKWRGHGKGWGESSLLFDRVGAKNVIISVGPNDKNLPSYTTIQRLEIAKKNIYRTDLNGTIYINVSNSSEYEIYTDQSTVPIIVDRGGKNVSENEKIINFTKMGWDYQTWRNSEN